MVVNDNNPKIWASLTAPNPDDVTYWVDLTADPHGNIIKFYDNNDEQWYNLTSPTSEYATYPYIGPNGNWFIENRDSGVRAQGDVPDATINGKRIADNPILTKEDIGLGNVANLAPEDYPVPDAVYGLIDGKVDETRTINGHTLDTDVVITKGDIGLGNVENIAPADMPISTATATALSGKTDSTRNIVAGSGLTGGGNLTADRTINVASATDGIIVNADNIQLNTNNTLTSTSTTQALSAAQGKVLNDKNIEQDAALLERPIMVDPTGDVITPSLGAYSKDEADAKFVAKTQVVQTEGTSTTNVMSQKAVTDELTALETDLNIKNAEQDASIKSIEQLLSQSNMNQTTQVSSTGREIVSLPKTASNGGMEVKLEGLTAQNLVVNGDFRNGTSGWAASRSVNTVLNNTLINTGNGTHSNPFAQLPSVQNKIGDIAYLRYKFRVTNSNCTAHTLQGGGFSYTLSAPVQNLWYNISQRATVSIGTSILLPHSYADAATANGKVMEIQSVIYVNLTATFGAGNEPDLATCDAMFSTYFEGSKSFIPTGRVRSVGKNLFYKELIATTDKFTITIDGSYKSVPVKLKPNTTYTMKVYAINSYNFVGKNIYFGIKGVGGRKDAIHSTIGLPTATVTSRPDGVVEIFLNFGTTQETQSRINTILENANIQLEQNSIATTYEPYKETELYLTAPDLKSNGLVKDEVRKGANGYELVKRVGVGTLGSEKITTWSFGTGITYDNGKLTFTAESSGKNAVALNTDTDYSIGDFMRISYNIDSYTSGLLYYGNVTMFEPVHVIDGYNVVGRYKRLKKTTALKTFGLYSSWVGSISNISLRKVIPQDGQIADNSIFTDMPDGTILYTLATPIITPIDHAGILNSAESGTVYHEPIVADAGIYGTNLTVLNTTYPISSLEEIIVHTTVDTYLDVSKAVIASDRLSFTHPDLRAGDLVLFTYFFNKEKVNGLITATYYDGRYVIADTSNGKFYKWGVKSTNGVATIQLTEV